MKNKLLFLIPPLFLVATNGNALKKVFDFRNSLGGFLFLNSTIGSAKRIIVALRLHYDAVANFGSTTASSFCF